MNNTNFKQEQRRSQKKMVSADETTAQKLRSTIRFPESLPVSAERERICELIERNQVLIVCGETGSGKTTQLPKMCLSLGRGIGAGGSGLIGHTQPRRLAATSTAKRIADELSSPFSRSFTRQCIGQIDDGRDFAG